MSNAYLSYAAKRLAQAFVVILLAYVFTFVVVSILPGDPITNVLRDPQNGFTEDEIRQIIAAQGLDQPIPVQYFKWLVRAAGGLAHRGAIRATGRRTLATLRQDWHGRLALGGLQ